MNKIVRAVIVPDMYTYRPLIGMDIGPEDMFKVLEHVMSLQMSEHVRAVITRRQSKKEEEAELVAEQTSYLSGTQSRLHRLLVVRCMGRILQRRLGLFIQ